jgi:hypothetical protein
MAAKKNTTHDATPKTRKGRPRKKAPSASDATGASLCAEVVPTQATQTPAEPAAEPNAETPGDATTAEPIAASSGSVLPTPAEETTAATADDSPEPAAGKLSALDAAAKILGETGQALSCPELITAMAAKGYWVSPKGRTPHATLYASFLRELHTKGADARFLKTERGKFMLKGTT